MAAAIDGRGTGPADAVVLLLHGGRARDRTPSHRGAAYLRMLPFAGSVARAADPARQPAIWRLRYRYRGWNAPHLDPVHDARWALREADRQYPGAPVVLVGHSMGARAALYAADAPNVVAVCALAPWLEPDDPTASLAGRALLIAHGDRDRVTDPTASLRYARRARAVTDEVCAFDVRDDGHAMLCRPATWHGLVAGFVSTVLALAPADPTIIAAINDPAGRARIAV